jgi:predicted MFS family arabinose efflux permease
MNETAVHVNSVPVRTWLAVTVLGISAFSIVTSELAPVGMLSTLAKDLNQTESAAGLVVTAYGWVGALAALLSAAIPARISRKALLVSLMFILALSCVAATCSSSMSTFMSARMVGAVAHGAFWALIGIVAAQLVPAEKLGLATSIIFAASRLPAFWVCLCRVLLQVWPDGATHLCSFRCWRWLPPARYSGRFPHWRRLNH